MSGVLNIGSVRCMVLLMGCVVISFCHLGAQHVTYKQYKQAGNEAFANKDYYNAFHFYSEGLRFEKEDSLDLIYNLGESAFQAWMLDTATYFFQRFIESSDTTCSSDYIMASYKLGIAHQRMNDYNQAIEDFRIVNNECDSSELTSLLTQAKNSVQWASGTQNFSNDKVVRTFLKKPDEHVLAPVYFDEEHVLYTRLFFGSERTDDFIHQVGEIRKTNSNYDSLFQNKLNGEEEGSTIGYLTFNHEKTSIYYAECRSMNTLDQQCRILTRTFSNDRLDTEYVVLEGIENGPISYTHPSYFRDTSGREGLYLVSNRPEGKGGTDIWFGWLTENGTKIDPAALINIKSINSAQNEVSPFYDAQTQNLYYSSDRLDKEKSYGGMDIYRASESVDAIDYQNAEILSKPINSSKNDIFYSTRGNTSWFSSNRTDPYNVSPEEDACCYDLFEVIDNDHENGKDSCQIYYYPEILDYCTSAEIANVKVRIFQVIEKDGADSIINEIYFDSLSQDERFPVERGKHYILTATKFGYDTDTLPIYIAQDEFLIESKDDDCPKSCTLFLKPTYSKLNVITKYARYRQDSTYALMDCTVLLIDNGQNVKCLEGKYKNIFEFRIEEMKSYVLEVRHPWFTTYRDTIAISYQQRDSCHRTVTVIMNRDINLYFENDVPESSNRSDTLSLQSYTDTWAGDRNDREGYASIYRESEYKSRYQQDSMGVKVFFNKMRSEIQAYESLKLYMFKRFISDPSSKINLLLEGHASPLADEKYNMALSQRRIHSIIRDLREDRRLWPFRNNILFKKIPGPRGEEESQVLRISDDKNNPNQSIYNPRAAEQRRITIRILPEGDIIHNYKD